MSRLTAEFPRQTRFADGQFTEITDFSDLRLVYEGVARDLNTADLGFTLSLIANHLRRDHLIFFIQQRSPDGEDWAPLAAVTIRRKGHDTILVEHQDLFRSVFDSGDPNHIEEIQVTERGGSLIFGTIDPKAIFHQEGTSKMPARRFLGFEAERVEIITDMIADAIVRNIRDTVAA